MSDQAPQTQQQTIFLKDYRPPAYYIPSTELYFDLRPGATRVRSRLQLSANPMASDTELARLSLHGQSLKLIALSLDGNSLSPDQYQLDDETLVIELEALLGVLPRQFELQIETEICPENNRSLEGLYQSSGMYCTQCEAEGFRKITYYLDRPDVMSEFTTHIEADAEQYPVMLSNGNKTEDKTLPSGRRCVSWHDPFKKPAYLFALVAGQLQKVSDSFTTKSGRE
ncbi:MAG: aminopeptidase N, partial [Cellvibrionaceae bacterium]|nr:aminopeptidase N [Cellvibrionaceae bacterium]